MRFMLLNSHETRENSTSSEVQTKLGADEKIGQEYDFSRDKMAKYIRISKLIPSLIERVDTGEISFLAAYDLSFVEDTKKQQRIADLMASDAYKLDMKKAELLRNYYETGKLTDVTTTQILSGEKTRKPKSDKPQPIKENCRTCCPYKDILDIYEFSTSQILCHLYGQKAIQTYTP